MPRVRQLLPEPADIDPLAAHRSLPRPAPPDRPWVLINMVASLDGATALDGRSGGLGSAADLAVFRALRAVPDVILAAAGTVRAERYGPPRPTDEVRAMRRAAGQAPAPRLAVVTRALDLDPALPLFADRPADQELPLVLAAPGGDPAARARLAGCAEIHDLDGPDGDPGEILAVLHARGARTVLVEGGPGFNGSLLAAGLVDELNLTIAPVLVGGSSKRVVHLADEAPHAMTLAHVWEHDGVLCLRHVRA